MLRVFLINGRSGRIAAALLSVCSLFAAGTAATAATRRDGHLVVRVSGLPVGVRANVRVRGPAGFDRILTAGRSFSVRPGVYRVLTLAVRFARTVRGVPAGSTALPARARGTALVRPGRTAVARARYGTIRDARVAVLHAASRTVIGNPRNPTALLMSHPEAKGLRAGSILAQVPTRSLPGGLFDRVTAVTSTPRRVRVSLTPATLTEAFPQLDVHETVPLSFGALAGSPLGAKASVDLSKVDLSFSKSLIKDMLEVSCGAPPNGWSFLPFGSLTPSVTADIHRGFLSLPYGKLTLDVSGTLGFDETIPSGAHCEFTVDGPKATAVVFIGDVPVPVEGSVNLKLSFALNGAAHVHASSSVNVSAGANLHGSYATPILDVKRHASGSLSLNGGAEQFGPEIQVGLGVDQLNAHVEDSVYLAAKSNGPNCELDFGGSAGIGLDLWAVHGSWDPISPETPIWQCPFNEQPEPPVGGPGAGGGGGTGDTGGGGGTGGGDGFVASAGPQIATAGASSCAIAGGAVACWGARQSGSGTPQLQAGVSDAVALSGAGLVNGIEGVESYCALIRDGTVRCGSPTGGWFAEPGISDATAVSVGLNACALISGGSIKCWGDNSAGQLGDGTTQLRTGPVSVLGISDAKSVSVGWTTTCAVRASGEVDCWGSDQFSFGSPNHLTPTPVPGISGAVTVASSPEPWAQTCALKADGSVDCWGQDGNGLTSEVRQIPGVSDAKAISVGSYHACELTAIGSVGCWGYNGYGQLGSGPVGGGLQWLRPVDGLPPAVSVAAGGEHTCAQLTTGHYMCWGDNAIGQLGAGTLGYAFSPVKVSGLSNVIALSSAGTRQCALRADQTVWCWGSGTGGPQATPVQVAGITGAVAVGMNFRTSCAALSDGTVSCWDGLSDTPFTPYSGLTGATAIAVGGGYVPDFVCVLQTDTGVSCAGGNAQGELGDRTTTSTTSAVAVSGVGGVTALVAGWDFACALESSGTVKCWGNNNNDQLGGATGAFSDVAVAVPGMSDVISLAADQQAACAVHSNGTVSCWGATDPYNFSQPPPTTPQLVPGISGARQVTAGHGQMCAVLSSGSVTCWQTNSSWVANGGGSFYPRASTVLDLSSVTSATAIAGGQDTACALLAAGTVDCWGEDNNGELGNGTLDYSAAPQNVAGI